MTEHIWPHPTLAEKFEELSKLDQAIRDRLKSVAREVATIANLQAELSSHAEYCVRLSIMQRDNAEKQLEMLESKLDRKINGN